MELRSCSDSHFIQTTRGGLVMKVLNIDSLGKPALVFKSLSDIYQAEDARRLGRSTSNSQGACADSEFDHCETSCLSVIDRRLRETKPETDKFVLSGNEDEMSSDSDENLTMEQLKRRFKTKKRKLDSFTNVNAYQAVGTEKSVEEISDLNEPLISLKSNISKQSNAKKKCTKRSVVASSEIAIYVKSEQDLVCVQVCQELPSTLPVKVEVPELELLGPQSITIANQLSIIHDEDLLHGGVASNETLKMVELENGEPMFAEESKNCFPNEVSYKHLEHLEPISNFLPIDEKGVQLANSETNCQEFLALSPLENDTANSIEQKHSGGVLPAKDQSSDMYNHSRSFNIEEVSGKLYGTSRVQGLNLTVDNDSGCVKLCHGADCRPFEDEVKEDLSCKQHINVSEKHCNSSGKLNISLKTDDSLISMKDSLPDEEQPSTSIFAFTPGNGSSKNHLEDELSMAKEKQAQTTPTVPTPIEERRSATENEISDVDQTLLLPELHQPPERLLSTRKVIPPSSQEQLCLSLNTVKLCNDTDQHECKEKLCFEKQSENKVSPAESDTEHSKMTENHGGLVQIRQRKVIMSPRKIFKKSWDGKSSLYKGNLERPRFPRTPSNFSTGCTSTKSCSESAIAFSRQQMHDFESLALKLVNELKSMKAIVEEKLLFEAYRNISSKNDADEVKSAINNATKVEETAKKWLSVMSRDCNRFCKILKLAQNKVPASDNPVPKQRKKIMFADEVGGQLCHVKILEDDATCQVSDSEKQ